MDAAVRVEVVILSRINRNQGCASVAYCGETMKDLHILSCIAWCMQKPVTMPVDMDEEMEG